MPKDKTSFLNRRYWHRVIRKEYRVTKDSGGICTLEPTDRHCIKVSRTDLTTSDTWERMP